MYSQLLRRPLAVWIALLSGLGCAVSAQDLFLTGAQLVDPATGKVSTGNLLILDGKIAGRPAEPPENFAGETLELTGKWILPGLHDLHTHSFGNQGPGRQGEMLGVPGTANRMLYAGVTGFLDLFNMEDMILGLRNRQRAGKLGGADIFASGPCLTCTKGHCSEYGVPTRIIDTPEDSRRHVTELAAKKPDVVKIVYHTKGRMPTVDLPTLEAAIKTAMDHGLKTVIHVGNWKDTREAILAGATAVTHVPHDGLIPDDLVELMRERGTFSIPTLAVHGGLARILADPALLEDPLLVKLAGENLRAAYGNEEYLERLEGWLGRQRSGRQDRLASVKKMSDAGVKLLTGTDAGNVGVFQGYSVHRELELMVEAGLTVWQALAASTTVAGEFLGRTYGLAVGDEASLVVLDASPVEDVRNTRQIYRVIHHGVVIDREKLLGNS